MWFVHRDVKRPRESFASHPSMFLLRFTEFQEKVTTVTICQKEEELSTTFQVLHVHKKRVSQLKMGCKLPPHAETDEGENDDDGGGHRCSHRHGKHLKNVENIF